MLVYKKVYDYVTNSWAELPFNTDPKDTIKVKIDVEKWRKMDVLLVEKKLSLLQRKRLRISRMTRIVKRRRINNDYKKITIKIIWQKKRSNAKT
jgi:hypothetical protein